MRFSALLLAFSACSFTGSQIDPPIDAAADATGDGPSENDGDGDGVSDDIDNCVDVPNPDQHNEDTDNFGDVCDLCPTRAAPQVDTDGDGLGDDCDPGPGAHHIVFADYFAGPLNAAWVTPTGTPNAATDGWSVASDALQQTSLTNQLRILTFSGPSHEDAVIELNVRVTALAGPNLNVVGLVGRFDGSVPGGQNSGTGYTCAEFKDNAGALELAMLNLDDFVGGRLSTSNVLAIGVTHRLTLTMSGGSLDCLLGEGIGDMASLQDTRFPTGTIALRTFSASADFFSVVVYAPE